MLCVQNTLTTYNTTAQLEALQIGGALSIGDSVSGTGSIDIADLSAADLEYGLNASGGDIDIGGWNGGTSNITLTARTGDITTQSGTITGTNLTLSAAGNIGSAGNRLSTDVSQIDYTSGGDVYVNEANAVTLNSGVQSGAGTVEIVTADGGVTIANGLTVFGDTLIAAGGTDKDLNVTGDIVSQATGTSSLTLRSGGAVILNSGTDISNATGAALNVTLNADRDQNEAGYIYAAGGSIITNGGNITMGGGLAPTTEAAWGTANAKAGVELVDYDLNSGAGDITLIGHGYNDYNSDDQYGVRIRSLSTLDVTDGNITITGSGGSGVDNNMGAWITETTITTAGSGDVTITGTGGSNGQTGSGANYGIRLAADSSVLSTGTGAITMTGTGGGGEDDNYGLSLFDDVLVSSAQGDITLTGTGSSNGQQGSGTNYGVYLIGSADPVVVRSTGTGSNAAKITITGTGGGGEDGNFGVFVTGAGTSVSAVDGDISITGIGGSNGQTDSNNNQGIRVQTDAVIASTGAGSDAATITMHGTAGAGDDSNYGLNLRDGTEVTSIDGAITMTGIGGSNGQTGSSSNLGLEIFDDSHVRSTGTGANAATITLSGTGGAGEDGAHGVHINTNGASVESAYGAIDITGIAGSNGQTDSNGNRGIYIQSSGEVISTGTGSNAATITLTGTGGDGQSVNHGVNVQNAGSRITSVDGAINITGTGGSNGQTGGANNYGILVSDDGDITSTGTGADAATITLSGTGGAGEDGNNGVRLEDTGTLITAVDGAIDITGVGGSNGQTGSNGGHGILVNDDVDITSTGTGANAATITLSGTGGAGDSGANGIRISNTGTLITSVDGAIDMTGVGGSNGQTGSSSNYGVLVQLGADIISTGTGVDAATITLDGTGGAGEGSNRGISIEGAGTQITSVDGAIDITGTGGSNGQTGSNANHGLLIQTDADVTSTGTSNAATITLTGTGGAGDMTNYGVYLAADGTSVIAVASDIVINGLGQGGAPKYGFRMSSASFLQANGAGANLTINANDVAITENPVISAGNIVTIAPIDSTSTIGIGGGGGDLNISDAELAQLTAGSGFIFGDSVNGSGAMDVDTVNFAAGRDISFYGGAIDFDGGLTNARDITFGGTSLVTTGGGLTGSRDVTLNVDSITLSHNTIAGRDLTLSSRSASTGLTVAAQDLTAGQDLRMIATGASTVSGGAFGATRDIWLSAPSLSMTNTSMAAGGDGFVTTDSLSLTNDFTAANEMTVRPYQNSGSIGLGSGVGTLSLSDALLAQLLPVSKMTIGYADEGTGVVSAQNLDLSAYGYDVDLYGGSFDLQGGVNVAGGLLLEAYTGDVGVYGAPVRAGGQTVFDVRQGSFLSDQGADVYQITGGNYILYADSYLSSAVGPLSDTAEFVFGHTSSTRPVGSFGASQNFVVLRDSLATSATQTGATDIGNQIHQIPQHPELVSFVTRPADLPAPLRRVRNPFQAAASVDDGGSVSVSSSSSSRGSGERTGSDANVAAEETRLREFDDLSAQEDLASNDSPIRQDKTQGIGVPTSDCSINGAKQIICDDSE